MTESTPGIGAITLFVADVDRAKEWYTRAFDRPVVFEDDVSAVLRFDQVLVNLLEVGAADELIAPVAVGRAGDGARSQLTVWVDDADAACARLRERGIELVNGPMDRPWGQRTALVADPDGHLWELAQTLT